MQVSHSNSGSGSGILRDCPWGVIVLLFVVNGIGRELVFVGTGPRLVANGGSSSSAAVGLSRRPDARRQSPGEGGGYQLRPRVGDYGYRGRGSLCRGRGV